MPVAYRKRAIGTVAFGNHGIASTTLIIRKEVVSFLTIGIGSYCHVRGKKARRRFHQHSVYTVRATH